MKYAVGDVLNYPNSQVTILSAFTDFAFKDTRDTRTTAYYVIHVSQNDYTTVINEKALDLGTFMYYFPTIAKGAATNGNVTAEEKKYRSYALWREMIYSCYVNQPNIDVYPYYGGSGTTVCPKWRCYEFFLIDFNRIQGACDFMRSNPRDGQFVMDFLPNIIDQVPPNKREYNLYSSHVCRFGQSFYMRFKSMALEAKKRNMNMGYDTITQEEETFTPRFLNEKNNKPNQPVNTMYSNNYITQHPEVQQPQKKYDEQGRLLTPPTKEEYERVIADPSFMDKYPKPDPSKVHVYDPFRGLIDPVREPREPGKKIMCVIVPKGSVNPYDS